MITSWMDGAINVGPYFQTSIAIQSQKHLLRPAIDAVLHVNDVCVLVLLYCSEPVTVTAQVTNWLERITRRTCYHSWTPMIPDIQQLDLIAFGVTIEVLTARKRNEPLSLLLTPDFAIGYLETVDTVRLVTQETIDEFCAVLAAVDVLKPRYLEPFRTWDSPSNAVDRCNRMDQH